MKTIQTNSGLKVKTSIKAGGMGGSNHNRRGLRVTTGLKAGGIKTTNHNRRALVAA